MADQDKPVPFRIFPGFAVPFVETELPDAKALNPALRTLFLERAAQGDIYRNADPTMARQHSLFESRFDLFQWPDPCVKQLAAFCTSSVFKLVAELNGYGREQMNALRMSADAWFHVARRGEDFGLHNHPMASWSGVYCVDSGYGSGAPASGELVFQHPMATAGMFVDRSTSNVPLPWSIRPRSYLLQPGQLVLFPSWLMHQVLAYQGDGQRITVAFNAWFSVAPKQAPAGT